MLKYFPQFNLDYVYYEMPLIRGWCLIGWALERDGWLSFSGVRRTSKSFLEIEVDKLVEEYYIKFKK